MDLTLLPGVAATFVLIVARIGTMIMLMPALGETSVPARLRLSLAVLLSLIFYPLVAGSYRVPVELPALVGAAATELAIGFVIGGSARLLMAALQTTGVVIANQTGLGFVTAVDPTQGQQGAMLSAFLNTLAVAMIFATDLHHLLLAALFDSYRVFQPGVLPPAGDVAQLITGTIAGTFRIAIQLSAPFLAFSLVFNVGLGILASLMPQMQVFFVGMPATIMLGLALFGVVLAAMMTTYLTFLQSGLNQLLAH